MSDLQRLITLMTDQRLLVLTGAGISTPSGIPDYRDSDGVRRGRAPMMYQEFLSGAALRQRYWARAMLGWPMVHQARANVAHQTLAELQARGRISGLITQNVDGLHDQAGSTEVVELHGNLHRVVCLDCRQRLARGDVQALMVAQNPYLAGVDATQAPDGDTLLDPQFEARFKVPTCPHCQGDRLKPDVVFFGENVVAATAERAMGLANEAPGLLVVGSSLMAYSAFRLCRAVAERGRPVVAINLGKTRGDDLLSFKLQLPCDQCLPRVAEALQ